MQRIPNHSLRAGLTGLLGTIGEPATNFILNAKTPAGLPKVFAIDFDANPFNPSDTGIARSIRNPDTEQLASFSIPSINLKIHSCLQISSRMKLFTLIPHSLI